MKTHAKGAIKKEAEMTRPLLPHDLPQLEALGLRMREARERRNITAELMAERIGVPLETLHSLEDGSASILLADFYRALRILGLARDINKLAVDEELAGKLLSIQHEPGVHYPSLRECDL